MKPNRRTGADAKLTGRFGHNSVAVARLRTDSTLPLPGGGRKGRRALFGISAVAAVVVAGSLAVTNLPGPGQKVTIVPAAETQSLMLWAANWNNSTVTAYPLGGPYGSPRVTISADIVEPQGLLFDHAGDLWVANAGNLAEFAKDQLTKPSPTPRTVIDGGTSFAGMAWDASGNLWVDDYGADVIDEYAKSQLARSGAPVPRVTLGGTDLSKPFGLAFDRAGDLWVGNEGQGQVLEYTKGQLTRSGSPAPKLDISGVGVAEQLVFDSLGDLWTATASVGSIIEYTKSQLTNPNASPAVTVTPFKGLLSGDEPGGLAIDPSGNLWVTTWDGETVVEFAKAQWQKTGSPSPHQTIQDPGGPVALAIGPS